MKAFTFDLEPLLFMRKTAEEACGEKLQTELHRLHEMQEILKNLHTQYKESSSKLQSGTISICDLEFHNRWSNRLLKQLNEARTAVMAQTKRVNELRKEMLELHHEKRAIEVLKEKEFKKYVKEADRQENKDNDELTIQRFSLNK